MKNYIAIFLISCIFFCCKKDKENVCTGFTSGDDVAKMLITNGANDLADDYSEYYNSKGAFFRLNVGILNPNGDLTRIGGTHVDPLSSGSNKSGYLKIDGVPFNRIENGQLLGVNLETQTVSQKFGNERSIKLFNFSGDDVFSEASLYLPKPFQKVDDRLGLEYNPNTGVQLNWKSENFDKFAILFLVRGRPDDPTAYKSNPLVKFYSTEDDGSFLIDKEVYQEYKGGWSEIYLIRWNSEISTDIRDNTKKNLYLATTTWSMECVLEW